MTEPPPAPPAATPPEAVAPFSTKSVLGRLGRRLELDEGSRVLEFGVLGLSAGVLLAESVGCHVTVADSSALTLERVRAQAEAAGVGKGLSLLQVDGASPSFPQATFELAICAGRARALAPLAALLRPVLLPSQGRLVAVVAVRVGVQTRDLSLWERALGAPLLGPQAQLAELARAGFEPEWAEALSEAQLLETYGGKTAAPDEEAALVQSGPAGISFMLVAARRREPDEEPPPARERG
jgi:protein-L-isoaspartate O-methyltransferase